MAPEHEAPPVELEAVVAGTPEEIWEAIATGRGISPAARVATEWLVEARDDGTCLVRMVMRGFGTGAGWDDELEGMAAGMRAALHALASYRTHFPGRPAAWVRVSGAGTGAAAAAWDELTGALGQAGAGPGRRFAAGPGAPELAGVVVRAGDDAYGRSLLLRLERPGPGLAELYLLGSGGSLGFQARLYGDDRDEVAVRQQPA
jgi:hypothetical protein